MDVIFVINVFFVLPREFPRKKKSVQILREYSNSLPRKGNATAFSTLFEVKKIPSRILIPPKQSKYDATHKAWAAQQPKPTRPRRADRLPPFLSASRLFPAPRRRRFVPPAAAPSAPPRRHVGDAAHEPGGHQGGGALRPGAADGGELPRPLRQRLLRRDRVPPQHQGVHGAGRRPDGDGQGRRVHLGRQVRGRVPGGAQARGEGHAVHGQLGAQHQRQPVLHHLRQAAPPQRPLHRVRQGHPRLRGARPHGEDPHRPRRPPARRDPPQPRHRPRQPARRLVGWVGFFIGYSISFVPLLLIWELESILPVWFCNTIFLVELPDEFYYLPART